MIFERVYLLAVMETMNITDVHNTLLIFETVNTVLIVEDENEQSELFILASSNDLENFDELNMHIKEKLTQETEFAEVIVPGRYFLQIELDMVQLVDNLGKTIDDVGREAKQLLGNLNAKTQKLTTTRFSDPVLAVTLNLTAASRPLAYYVRKLNQLPAFSSMEISREE